MLSVLSLVLVLALTPFESAIDRAFNALQINDSAAAASALDDAYESDAAAFDANNFHYLRGRMAEVQSAWTRAGDEFGKIDSANPLYALASFHAALASVKLHDDSAAEQSVSALPKNFPAELKMQIARGAGAALALKIYQDLATREARYERARVLNDNAAFWSLIRENKDDDAALYSARAVAGLAVSPGDQMEVAEVFAGHREFDAGLPLYRQAAADPMYAADARYQIARIYFQQRKYESAIDEYRSLAADFQGTDWQKDAEYQIASCYWRLGQYDSSAKAYVAYIQKYGHKGMEEAATRNLIDVYRVQGENQKAIAALDRALASQLSVSTRQVFLFTKAKILYTQKRYAAALALFQQLGRMKLRSAPGGATSAEAEYFQALCQSRLGNKTAANLIWRKLSRDEFSFYGRRSAEKLAKGDKGSDSSSPTLCPAERGPALKNIESDLAALRHPLRTAMDSAADPVSELVFLRQWDEATFWMSWSGTSLPKRASAEIAYLGGDYDRAISLADRLPRSESTMLLLYPPGYRSQICDAAAKYKADPLWLHAVIWQESKYNPRAHSAAAARGLMQFIPETAEEVASGIGWPALPIDNLYDPAVSIQLGAAYWSSLMKQFESPELALAAYNGGPDNVQRWMSKSPDPELFVSDIGFVETKKYVMLVYAARAAYASLLN